jgi:methyl-accepting chemotaxis protein
MESEFMERVARLEHELEARAAASDATLTAVREAITETRNRVQTAFEFFEDRICRQATLIEKLQLASEHADDLVERVAASVNGCDRSVAEIRQAAAESAESVALALQRMDARLDKHDDSIVSAQAVAGRTDDLLERVVESIDSLQSFVLERIR